MAFPVMGQSVPVMATAGLTIDPHVKLLDDRVVRRAKARGLDGLVYAPHFTRLSTIRARARRYTGDDFLVIPGREVFTGRWRNRKHVLGIGLSDPIPDFISLEGAMAAFRRQEAAVLVPHPAFMTVSLDAGDLDRYRETIHSIETYNPKVLPPHTRRARALRDRYGLPEFASSYAHIHGTVGEVWTRFPDIEPTEAAVIDAILEGAPRETGRLDGVAHRTRCLAEFAHLFVENTWQKLDRVVLSGTEPTHPDHPAYDGRFDGVASY